MFFFVDSWQAAVFSFRFFREEERFSAPLGRPTGQKLLKVVRSPREFEIDITVLTPFY